MSKANNDILESRIKRFVKLNTKMREATLESEREFLKLAGNISAAQLQLLLAIGDNEPCAMSKLAEIMHFSKSNVTQMVERLIKNRFVKKLRREDDQRIVEVMLLAKGQKIVDLNKAHVERVARDWFSKMTDEEQEGMLTMWEQYLK